MSNEIYTVIIRSNNLVSGTNTQGVFRVDWQRVLPKHHTKYRVDVYFRTNMASYTIGVDDYVYLECPSFSRPRGFDSKNNSQGNAIAVAPLYWGSSLNTNTYYHETPPGVNYCMMAYPLENNISINLTNATGAILTPSATLYSNWSLILNFSVVAD